METGQKKQATPKKPAPRPGRAPKPPGRGGSGQDFPVAQALALVQKKNAKFKRETLHGSEGMAGDPFRVLVGCLVSLRTRDPQTLQACANLFPLASDPAAMLALGEEKIAELIAPCAFHRAKAADIMGFCRKILEEHGGSVPDTMEGLTAFKGVGRKTANLVLTLGFGLPGICVDTHVHRICNRWGYVETKAPDKTEARLREILPREFWAPINDWLVVFGQNVCVPVSPKCSQCPLTGPCRQVGVDRRR